MGFLWTLFFAIAGIALIDILLSGLFMFLGAKWAEVEDVTFWHALGVSFVSGILTWMIAPIIKLIPKVGPLISIACLFLLSLFVIKSMFEIDWNEAFKVWLGNILARALAIIAVVFTFGATVWPFFTTNFF